MTYSEKLKDPRWQKRRLEIMQRDEFRCRICRDEKNTLNVHHCNYYGDPWEAPDEDLVTLCESCHAAIESLQKKIHRQMVEPVHDSPAAKIEAYDAFQKLMDQPASAFGLYHILATETGRNTQAAFLASFGEYLLDVFVTGLDRGWSSEKDRTKATQK